MPSSYQPRRGGYEPLEPGQIPPGQGHNHAHASLPRRPTREWEHERDPRVPPTVGTAASSSAGATVTAPRGPRADTNPRRRSRSRSRSSSSSRSSRSRSRSRSPPPLDFNTKELRTALDSFARAMHATLLSTSAHSLETQHLKRLEAFPRELVNPDNLLEAQQRTRDAESDLNAKLRDVHAAFDLLMSRTLAKLPAGGRRGGSAAAGLERRMRDKVDYTELLAVKKRVGQLERERDQEEGKGKGKGKEKETAAVDTAVDSTAGEKRGRARALLDDMINRLEKVEGMRTALEDRYTDLEDMVNWRVQEDLEVQRLGNGRWKMIEDLRDPDGVIRGSSVVAAKRRRIELSPDPPEASTPGNDAAILGDQASKAEMTSLVPASPATTGTDPAVELLRQEVESLKQELKSVKDGQAERDKKLAEETIASLKAECVKICREQILKTVEVLKNDGRLKASPSIGSSATLPGSGKSPAVSASPVLPTVPQGSAPPAQQQQPIPVPTSTSPRSTSAVAQSPVLPPPRPASHLSQTQQRQASRDMSMPMSIEMPSSSSTLAGWVDNNHNPHHHQQTPQSAPPSSAPASNPLNRLMQPHPQPPPVQYPHPTGHGVAPYDTYRPPPPPPPQQQPGGASFVQKMSNVLPQPPAPPQYMQMSPVHNGSPHLPPPGGPGQPYGFQAWSQYGPSAPPQ